MENALYYTFSTIPQTLGAAFGVLAAFVLYRFQVDNGARGMNIIILQELLSTKSVNQGYHTVAVDGNTLLSEGRDAEFVALIERTGVPEPAAARQFLAYKQFAASVRDRPIIRRSLFRTFLATSTLIVYSVLVLWCEPWLKTRVDGVAHVVLGVGVAGLVWCLMLYWQLISRLLEAG